MIERQGRNHPGDGRQDDQQLVNRVEDRLLVLLQITVVRQRQPFESRQQPSQVADQPSRLAPSQLGDVGVLFCGMMLDPVDHSSARVANPNSCVTQMITSSLNRERSTAI